MKQSNQKVIDLYAKAVDLAKENDRLSNQDKLLLNRFKILLRSKAVSDANSELAQIGKVRRKTLHRVRELAEGVFEDWVRNLNIADTERDRMLEEGKKRADFAENLLLHEFERQGLVVGD